jgi:hypothetical protein
VGAVKELVTTLGPAGAAALVRELAEEAARTAGPAYFSARWNDESRRWQVQRRQGVKSPFSWEDGIDPERDAVLGEVEGLTIGGRRVPYGLVARRIRAQTGEHLPVRIYHAPGSCWLGA